MDFAASFQLPGDEAKRERGLRHVGKRTSGKGVDEAAPGVFHGITGNPHFFQNTGVNILFTQELSNVHPLHFEVGELFKNGSGQ